MKAISARSARTRSEINPVVSRRAAAPKRRARLRAAFTHEPPNPVLTTKGGRLHNCDCLDLLGAMRSESADLFFADPPFNCGKDYGLTYHGRRIDDRLDPSEYLSWCREWLRESVRVLKPGGALYVYNLARWNMDLGVYLKSVGLRLGNWITVNINGQLPVRGRLLQQGYSMLYFTKGSPKTFNRVLIPLRRCRHCDGYAKDYGGKLPRYLAQGGVHLSDVWDDVTAVRHRRFRSAGRGSRNQLSTKIVERVLSISTRPGDLVVDVFGGSGTTYAVAEAMGRRWLGCEIGPCEAIVERLTTGEVRHHSNADIVVGQDRRRGHRVNHS